MSLRGMIIGCAEILDGLTRVLSFGSVHLNTSFRVTAWLELRRLRARLEDIEADDELDLHKILMKNFDFGQDKGDLA